MLPLLLFSPNFSIAILVHKVYLHKTNKKWDAPFTNDIYPRSTNLDGSLQTEADWAVIETRVKRGASIGSNATILAGLTIGERALIGAGAVVTRDVADYAIVAGVPARVVGDVRDRADP